MFVLGALLLARKPVAVTVGVSEGAAPVSPAKPAAAKPTRQTSPAPASKAAANMMASFDASTNSSLDALKEQLFRLELRHQAGTISEKDYASERAKAEQILRDLVRG